MKKKIAWAVVAACVATVVFGVAIPVWAESGFVAYLQVEGIICGIIIVASAFAWAANTPNE